MGKLNGDCVTFVAIAEHSSSYGSVCLYYCREEYRGKGYGLKTWRTALAGVSPTMKLGLHATMSSVPLYEREGFKSFWKILYYKAFVSSILEAYSNIPVPDGVSVIAATEVDFAKLKEYTEKMIGFAFSHSDLLEKWITLPTHTALAAVDVSGDIVGFAAIRETIRIKKEGFILGPLIADIADIARLLLLRLASTVEQAQQFTVTVPYDTNPEALVIADEINGEKIQDYMRMYTGNKLPMKTEMCFGVFAGFVL